MSFSRRNSTDMAILDRVLGADKPTMTAQVARHILVLDFGQADKERMHQLSAKARDGKLTPDEEIEIDSYERAGHILSTLQSKARRSLNKGRSAKNKTR